MIRKLNRIFQDYMRQKRLKIGRYFWDRKEKKEEREKTGKKNKKKNFFFKKKKKREKI